MQAIAISKMITVWNAAKVIHNVLAETVHFL